LDSAAFLMRSAHCRRSTPAVHRQIVDMEGH
jgi:hypothetical protein